MACNFLCSINYWAVLAAGAAYWLFGALWFSFLVGKDWAAELKKHGVIIHKHSKKQMNIKFIATFLLNVLVALGIAVIIYMTGTSDIPGAIKLGLVLGILISAATMEITYLWEGRGLTLFFYDAGYHVIGIVIATIILALWK